MKKSKLMGMLLMGFMACQSYSAQDFTLPECSNLGSNSYGPMNSSVTANSKNRFAYILNSSQLTAISGGKIDAVYFKRSTATGTLPAGTTMKIYLKNTTATDFGTSNLDWATEIASATLVYNGDPAAIVGNSAGYKKFPVTGNFDFENGKNLEILTEYVQTTGPSSSIQWNYEYTAPCVTTTNNNTSKYWNGTGALSATLSTSNYRRPLTAFDVTMPPATVAPTCTTVSAPANNATNVSVTPTISWAMVGGATGSASSYLINLGTTPGGTDVLNGYEVTTSNYTIPAGTALNYSTTYFVTILPKNAIGTASGCTETQFTTMSLPCPTVTAPANNANGQSLTPTITWDAQAGVSGYTVTVGSTPGASDVVGGFDVGNATSYTFSTPLNAGVNYYYTINSYTASATSQSCTERSFTTMCTPYTIPYFEGFESGYTHNINIAGCLSQETTVGTQTWTANNTFTDYNRTPRTGSWNAFLRYSNTDWLFIPIQLTGGTTYKFTAYARQDDADATDAKITVAYGATATSAAMTNAIVAETGVINGDYQKISGNFTPATTGTYFVGIKGYVSVNPWYISLDDISIDVAGACLEPVSITSTGTTVSSIDVSWVAPSTIPANGYDVYYSASNTPPTATSTPNASVPNTQTTYSVIGLTQNTQYFVWVRSKCSATELSAWTGPVAVYTSCGAANVPYTMDFESAVVPAMPNCTTTQNAGSGNNWIVSNNPGTGFSTKTLMYGYNSTNAANAWFYTQGINLIGGQNYTIAFDYGNNDNGYTESLKVAYGTAADAASMSNVIVDIASINQGTKQNGSYNFTAPTTGVYYFGFNAKSAADQWNLYVDDINITVATMGTSELANAKDGIKIYPNPFADVLTISDVRNVKSISVADASGRLVKTINKPSNELQLGDLKTGMYLLTLEFKDGSTKTIKVMKK